jgi:hypothetical protein
MLEAKNGEIHVVRLFVWVNQDCIFQSSKGVIRTIGLSVSRCKKVQESRILFAG